MFLAKIYITLKSTVNDPQGQTVHGGLKTLGYDSVESVRMGKYLEVKIQADERSGAEAQISEMCHKLLSNPVIEDFHFDLEELS
ncbi:MAG: phosphoribosylformylglycinamidine synthase subunit PurS [Dehalococcoidia bacterium]|nr:phosphoribosylformylglycinamidine synthase subunit PurS [Dehalococcoidia bacterium]